MTPATCEAVNRLIPSLRKQYPQARIGILGRVNQHQGPMCPCGSHDLIVVWATPIVKICPHCNGKLNQLSLSLEVSQ